MVPGEPVVPDGAALPLGAGLPLAPGLPEGAIETIGVGRGVRSGVNAPFFPNAIAYRKIPRKTRTVAATNAVETGSLIRSAGSIGNGVRRRLRGFLGAPRSTSRGAAAGRAWPRAPRARAGAAPRLAPARLAGGPPRPSRWVSSSASNCGLLLGRSCLVRLGVGLELAPRRRPRRRRCPLPRPRPRLRRPRCRLEVRVSSGPAPPRRSRRRRAWRDPRTAASSAAASSTAGPRTPQPAAASPAGSSTASSAGAASAGGLRPPRLGRSRARSGCGSAGAPRRTSSTGSSPRLVGLAGLVGAGIERVGSRSSSGASFDRSVIAGDASPWARPDRAAGAV